MNGTVLPHNERASAVWSAGGRDYDEVSRGISDALEHAVRRLNPSAGQRVLDLATGTGWTSRLLARRGVRVTGADIAQELLQSARQLAAAEQLSIDYLTGDAENLPFADADFDHVISTFGVMFAARPEVAAAELARVCKPGGRLALTTWLPDSAVVKMFSVMRPYMPAPPTPAPPSPFEWGQRERLQALLGRHFDLKFEEGVSVYRDTDGETAWNQASTGYGPTRMLATHLEPARREALKQDFIAFNEGYRTELGIAMPRGYLVTVGTRRSQ